MAVDHLWHIGSSAPLVALALPVKSLNLDSLRSLGPFTPPATECGQRNRCSHAQCTARPHHRRKGAHAA